MPKRPPFLYIIATNIGSLPELIGQANESGVLITPDDSTALIAALREIQEDQGAWHDRRREAMKRAQNFSVTFTVEKLHALFETVGKK